MTDVPVELEWVRDRKERFVLDGPVIRFPDWKSARPGEFVSYQPLDDASRIVAEFANIRGMPGVKAFVNKFGPLTWKGRQKDGDRIALILKRAQRAEEILDAAADTVREAEGEEIDKHALELAGFLEETDDTWEMSDEWGALKVRLIPADSLDLKPRLVLSPRDLLSAIPFMIAQRLSAGATFRRCRHCGKLFEAGGGAGRTKSARYCSPEHQIEFNRPKPTAED